MSKQKKSIDAIVLLAKQSGISSFSSLWQIKNALNMKKIGHTGTLDTFAEGLLVALSGRLTRLVPYITNCFKTYIAEITFGSETDTLDPDGSIISEKPLPIFSNILSILPAFSGEIDQIPPLYSALHVAGQRASDRVRKGEIIELSSRKIEIFSLKIISAKTKKGIHPSNESLVSSIIIEVTCSKGTYIRSLARDIAIASGSCAHLSALRRTAIGPFNLEKAAGTHLLASFASVPPKQYGVGDRPPLVPAGEIIEGILPFTPQISTQIGLFPITISENKKRSFLTGVALETDWFTGPFFEKNSVFSEDVFLGVVQNAALRPSYEFVAGDGL